MESVFANNSLQVNFDDIKTTEEYAEGFRKLDIYANQMISQINAQENAIIEKRKLLNQKRQELLRIQQEAQEWDTRRGGKLEDQVQETAEKAFEESLNLYMIDNANIHCDNEDRIDRIVLSAPLDIGKHFAVYIDTINKTLTKICLIKDDLARSEEELTKEKIIIQLNDIGSDIAKEIQKFNGLRDQNKLTRAQMGCVLLEYILNKD